MGPRSRAARPCGHVRSRAHGAGSSGSSTPSGRSSTKAASAIHSAIGPPGTRAEVVDPVDHRLDAIAEPLDRPGQRAGHLGAAVAAVVEHLLRGAAVGGGRAAGSAPTDAAISRARCTISSPSAPASASRTATGRPSTSSTPRSCSRADASPAAARSASAVSSAPLTASAERSSGPPARAPRRRSRRGGRTCSRGRDWPLRRREASRRARRPGRAGSLRRLGALRRGPEARCVRAHALRQQLQVEALVAHAQVVVEDRDHGRPQRIGDRVDDDVQRSW